ncbi:MAG: guanylate cyclase, partial [Spirochaetia bacterium]|nr:guanylate cyclase [Spirochaetia bacterium]
WYQLPWAVPGFLTFIVGLSLAGAGIYALPRKENKPLLITFILFSMGFGFLGLVLAFRAVILDQSLLLLLNRIPYFGVVWLSPGALMFCYYLTDKRYRSLLVWGIIALGTVLFSSVGLATGYDFTGSWFHYPFGSYPIAQLPLRLWGAVSSIAYVVAGVPMTIHYYRHHRDELRQKKYLFIGLHAISLLVITNLPSLAGVSIFPMSAFAFVPLLILAYGIFRSDFLNVNELLFQKRGLFKVLSGLITGGFLAIAMIVALTLKPADHAHVYAEPLFLIPLFSGVCAFALAIFIAGSNPDRKLNMLAAASLMLAGAFMIIMTDGALG